MRQLLSHRQIFAAVLLSMALFFTCRGIAMSSFAMGHADENHATCCTQEGATALSIIHGQLQSALPSPLATFVAFALAFITSVALAFRIAPQGVGAQYARRVRARWGSWRVFIYWLQLFRTGILNTKTY